MTNEFHTLDGLCPLWCLLVQDTKDYRLITKSALLSVHNQDKTESVGVRICFYHSLYRQAPLAGK